MEFNKAKWKSNQNWIQDSTGVFGGDGESSLGKVDGLGR